MPLVNYVDHQGNAFEADVPVGGNAMQGAVDNMIDGILGECGGVCVCATCHVMVDDSWLEKTGSPTMDEGIMLEAVTGREENSRLSCQITITEEMDGLVLHMPKSQY